MSDDSRAGATEAATALAETVRPVPDTALSDPALDILELSLWYGDKRALNEVSLAIPRREITAFIGPSGCGKSTLLRCFNRLNDLVPGVRTEGDVHFEGRSVFGEAVDVNLLRTRIGIVFQKSNPFPKSIYENVVFGLRLVGVRDRRILDEACEDSLRAAALWDEVKDRLKDGALGLSGGQQQRLCIARAIATQPEILLYDEPCSALDPRSTQRIEELMTGLRSRFTQIIVTHNLQQAARLSDRTEFLYLGDLVEYGPTQRLFVSPSLQRTEDYITGRFG